MQSLALDMRVLTENKEELEIKDLLEADYDDVPQFKERENKEEVSIEDITKAEIEEVIYEDTEEVNLDEDFGFNTKDMFDDDDDEIDTTVPDDSLFDDDFEDLDIEDDE